MSQITSKQPVPTGAEAALRQERAEFDRVSSARSVQNAALAETGGVWTAAISGEPPALTCPINATALGFLESVEGPDGNFVRSVVVQTNADIHNPYVFVGVTLGVFTDVFDDSNVTLHSFYNEAFAGAITDLRGNNKSYTWVRTSIMPEGRLQRIAGIRIRLVNVS